MRYQLERESNMIYMLNFVPTFKRIPLTHLKLRLLICDGSGTLARTDNRQPNDIRCGVVIVRALIMIRSIYARTIAANPASRDLQVTHARYFVCTTRNHQKYNESYVRDG